MLPRLNFGLITCLSLTLGACGVPERGQAKTVVVYSGLEQEFAEPVLQAYGKRTASMS